MTGGVRKNYPGVAGTSPGMWLFLQRYYYICVPDMVPCNGCVGSVESHILNIRIFPYIRKAERVAESASGVNSSMSRSVISAEHLFAAVHT